MAASTAPTPAAGKSRLARRGPRRADDGFRYLALAAGLLVLAILALIAWSTTKEALPSFREEGLGFLTSSRWAPNEGSFGTLAFIYGTFFVSLIALVFAVPASIGIALFITQLAPARVRKVTTFVMDLLAAVPSVVFGLWGVSVLAVAAPGFYESIGSPLAAIPGLGRAFDEPYNGKSFLSAGFIVAIYVLHRKDGFSGRAGGLALACLMLPIVIRSTEAMLQLVPDELRHAACALGTSKSRTILTVVVPAALPGITSGALLALARAAGETAPLLFTIGASRQYNWSLSGPNTALSAQIFSNAQTGFPNAIDRAWGAALTLIVLVLLLSTIARVAAARFTVR